jgi:carboxylesterase
LKQQQTTTPILRPFEGEEHLPFTDLRRGATTAALLIHGFPGTPAEVRPLARSLQYAGISVAAPLLPGFGADIPTLGKRSHSEWIDTVRTLTQNLRAEHERVILVGYSMGGAIAIHAASEDDPRPDALVLLAPFWQLGPPWLQIALPILARFVREIRPFAKTDFTDPRTRRDLLKFIPDANLDDEPTREAVRQISLPFRVINELRILGRSAHRLAPQLTLPTLVLQGTEDRIVPSSGTRRLVRRMSDRVDYQEFPADHQLIDPVSPSWSLIENRIIEFFLNR